MPPRARFIWTSDQPPDQDVTFRSLIGGGAPRRSVGVNRWVLFRRTFELPANCASAQAKMTVDGRYKLYVNGGFVGRGPCRSSPAYQRVDSHEIARHLKPGTNVIAMLVHVYGVDMAWYQTAHDVWQRVFGDGALLFDAEICCGGQTITLVADESWHWFEGTAWRRDTPRSGWGQDFIEDFDANLLPAAWTEPGFDDSSWPKCRFQTAPVSADDASKGWGPVRPFPTLVDRELPALMETPVVPVKVVAVRAVIPDASLALDRRIYDEQTADLPEGMVEDVTALLSPDARATIVRTREGCDVSILLAFDKRHSGFPCIEIDALGGEVIELAVAETIPGEYAGQAPAVPRVARETYLDCAHLFRYVARPGVQRFEKFEWTAVKYVQVFIRNAPGGLRIRHVGSTHLQYPLEFQGAFECSDAVLNHLWQVGCYTVRECTHDAFEDCPSREKRQWLGDAFVHYLVHAAAFGGSTRAIDRQSLIMATEDQRQDGLMQMFAPGDHHTNGIIIPDFNLHWVLAVHHYFLHTADLELVETVFPAMQRMLAWFERQLGPHDLLVDLPYWHFIEWAHVGRDGEAAIINAMYVGALRSAASLADSLGYERAGRRYAGLAERISAAINTRMWDEARGVYVDMVDPQTGVRNLKVSQHANAAMILWDIAPPPRWPRMIDRITDSRRLKLTAAPPVAPTGAVLDLHEDVVQANTYFGHFVNTALGKAGRFDLALHAIREHFGPMLDTGTETLWESFEPAASLCHAFSAGAVYLLSAHVLGVTPLAPGFSRMRIAPQCAGLAFANGAYPTPHGTVSVQWRLHDGTLNLTVTVPSGCEAEVVTPHAAAVATVGPGTHQFINGVKQA